jgi:hypothetical protein
MYYKDEVPLLTDPCSHPDVIRCGKTGNISIYFLYDFYIVGSLFWFWSISIENGVIQCIFIKSNFISYSYHFEVGPKSILLECGKLIQINLHRLGKNLN